MIRSSGTGFGSHAELRKPGSGSTQDFFLPLESDPWGIFIKSAVLSYRPWLPLFADHASLRVFVPA
jgi:hypothetical protein